MYHREPNYEAEHAITNRINAKTRRCRIGKVRLKTGVPWVDKGLSDMKPPYLDTTGCRPIAPWMMPGHWCNQASA